MYLLAVYSNFGMLYLKRRIVHKMPYNSVDFRYFRSSFYMDIHADPYIIIHTVEFV